MSDSFCIKTEPIAKDYEQEDTNNDANTLCYNTIKLENFTNMGNYIKKDELSFDKIEENVPKNVDESTIGKIKEENVDEMDELLQQHLTTTITQQISVPKLEIMDVHDSDGDTDANVSDDKNSSQEVSTVLKKKVLKYKRTDKTCKDNNTEKTDTSYSRESKTHTEHTCELCGKSYPEYINLRKHMRYKHPLSMDTEYICKICDQRFATQTGLDRHCNRTHRKPTKHKCEICGTCYVDVWHLQIHIRRKHPTSIDTEYICEICNERFTTRRGRDKHSYLMHPAAQTPAQHKCEICGSCYLESQTLRAHIRTKHPASIDTQYICEICHKRFITKKALNIHSKKTHTEAQTLNEHKCELCCSSYTEVSSLLKHVRKKHPSSISEYICEICKQGFATQTSLDRHTSTRHLVAQKPTNHKCEICGRCYLESRNLQSHIRKKHPSSIDTVYICEICNQRFTTQIGLHRHSFKMHSVAQKPTKHKCEICGIFYSSSHSLQAHIKQIHPTSIDLKYMCEICNQGFTTHTGLTRHSLRMHPVEHTQKLLNTHSNKTHPEAETLTDHKCEICGSCFTGSKYLAKHIRSKHPSSMDTEYIGEICNQGFTTQKSTKHKCEICGSCYTESCSLQNHIKQKHPWSIDIKYICEICNEGFTTHTGLTRHSLRMHPEAQTPTKHKCEIQSHHD
ncbi:uncharacterized protein [Musca autumnalis]|uniref:uncharacterized protein n=1 Tax=Musca autumnalis TaxID=221902 RepID=UPI003CFB6E39